MTATHSSAIRHEFKFHENLLLNDNQDFSSAYLSIKHLRELIESHPRCAGKHTLKSLSSVLYSQRHTSQRMVLLLYREACNAIREIAIYGNPEDRITAITILEKALKNSVDIKHRAVAESIGGLPVCITAPSLPPDHQLTPVSACWKTIAHAAGVLPGGKGWWAGRSYLTKTIEGKLAVFKFLNPGDDPAGLAREIYWLEYLYSNQLNNSESFHIPRPVKLGSSVLFSFSDLPFESINTRIDSSFTAICFVAAEDYFVYPNGTPNTHITRQEQGNMIIHSAYLFGKLASQGILHTAPVPLFHNRIQQDRREDGGIYLWRKGGRLDRWLDSSNYPNFGKSGIRDFEHIDIFQDRELELYESIGIHILGIVLVTGSCFRQSETGNRSDTTLSKSIDKRHLFDISFFSYLLKHIFLAYYLGFTGSVPENSLPFNPEHLAERLTDAMGTDNDMEEVLRVADQNMMTDTAFYSFLNDRNIPSETIMGYNRGEKDIVFQSGPHLGGFNSKISVPELVTFLETVASSCIAGRFRSLNFQYSGGTYADLQ